MTIDKDELDKLVLGSIVTVGIAAMTVVIKFL